MASTAGCGLTRSPKKRFRHATRKPKVCGLFPSPLRLDQFTTDQTTNDSNEAVRGHIVLEVQMTTASTRKL